VAPYTRVRPRSRTQIFVRFDIIRSFGWAPCTSVRFPFGSEVTDTLRSWEGDWPPFRHRAIYRFVNLAEYEAVRFFELALQGELINFVECPTEY
jgi:hypothetical protein